MILDGVQDGEPEVQQVGQFVDDPVGSTLAIGASGDEGLYFEGVIDDIRIYDKVLSQLEIDGLFTELDDE